MAPSHAAMTAAPVSPDTDLKVFQPPNPYVALGLAVSPYGSPLNLFPRPNTPEPSNRLVTRRSEVRFRRQTGKHLLMLSLTGFDPLLPSGVPRNIEFTISTLCARHERRQRRAKQDGASATHPRPTLRPPGRPR